MSDDLLTVQEVAAHLKLNPQTVRRWIRGGRLRAVRVGARQWRVKADDIGPARSELPEPTPEVLRRRQAALNGLMELQRLIGNRPGPSVRALVAESRRQLEARGEVRGD